MAVAVRPGRGKQTVSVIDKAGERFWYSLYGLTIRSDVRLPVEPASRTDGDSPDVVMRRVASDTRPTPLGVITSWEPRDACGPACQKPGPDCPIHRPSTVVRRDGSEAWLWNRSIGTIHARPREGIIDVYPRDLDDERPLGLMLACAVMLFVLQKLGRPSLHAGAVVLDDAEAVAFLGRAGHGKSTMAAGLLQRGATFITDDALPLRQIDGAVYGGPSLPMMRIWPETATRGLGLAEELPNILADFEKRLLAVNGRFTYAAEPVRLRAIYILERYAPAATGRTDCSIQQLRKCESLALLMGATITRAFMLPNEDVELLPLYARLAMQAPLRVLRYPSGFEYQDAVYQRLRADLADR
jgi:hypothetical protein